MFSKKYFIIDKKFYNKIIIANTWDYHLHIKLKNLAHSCYISHLSLIQVFESPHTTFNKSIHAWVYTSLYFISKYLWLIHIWSIHLNYLEITLDKI